ncbi:MAG: hypothetical protein Q4C34_04545 [Bacteroidales bacterium]|nr:hypothetical protein [Bacteroidales bacterium]
MKILLLDSPTDPRLEMALIADSARRPDRRPLFVPESGSWICELRLCVRISRLGKCIAEAFAPRYYDAVSAVCLLRPTDRSRDVRYMIMDDTMVQGDWTDLPAGDSIMALAVNGEPHPMSLPRGYIDRAVHELSADMTFKTGDMLILPEVMAAYDAEPGNTCTVTLNDKPILDFNIK